MIDIDKIAIKLDGIHEDTTEIKVQVARVCEQVGNNERRITRNEEAIADLRKEIEKLKDIVAPLVSIGKILAVIGSLIVASLVGLLFEILRSGILHTVP